MGWVVPKISSTTSPSAIHMEVHIFLKPVIYPFEGSYVIVNLFIHLEVQMFWNLFDSFGVTHIDIFCQPYIPIWRFIYFRSLIYPFGGPYIYFVNLVYPIGVPHIYKFLSNKQIHNYLDWSIYFSLTLYTHLEVIYFGNLSYLFGGSFILSTFHQIKLVLGTHNETGIVSWIKKN